MKCYAHPNVDAVGVCAVCKRPLCRSCQVVFEGRRFCKEHAEKRLIREERAVALHRRGASLTVASILAFTNGLAAIVVGFLLVVIGLLGPTASSSPIVESTVGAFLRYFSAVTLFPADQTLTVGFVAFFAGTVGLAAAYYLWRRSKAAAVVCLVLAVFGEGFVATYLEVMALAGVFTFVWIVAVAASAVLIAIGWRHLR